MSVVMYSVAGGAVMLLTITMLQTWYYGLRLRVYRDDVTIASHTRSANRAIATTIVAVLAIEGLVIASGPGAHRADLLYYHLPFAIGFAALLTALRWLTPGTTRPHLHKWLAHSCVVCFLIALGSGLYLFLGH